MKKLLAVAVLAFLMGGCRQMLGGQSGLYLNGDDAGCCVDAHIWGKCKSEVQCCAAKRPWVCHCNHTENCCEFLKGKVIVSTPE
jgi:hypothetical protein